MSMAYKFLRKMIMPVTVMMVPHTARRTYMFNMPMVLLICLMALAAMGGKFVFEIGHKAFMYKPIKAELDYYTSQLTDIESTIESLKLAETEFSRLLSYGNNKDILEHLNTSYSGDLDMDVLKRHLERNRSEEGAIKGYIETTENLYRATPMGFPVGDAKGVTSKYGERTHPMHGGRDFHSGVDLSSRPGTLVRATADGIVSYSGRSGANGNVIAIEHGYGYQTFYGHNKKNLAQAGDKVRRGDVIAQVGSTGSTTGPHVHYEIWKEGRSVDPRQFIRGGRN